MTCSILVSIRFQQQVDQIWIVTAMTRAVVFLTVGPVFFIEEEITSHQSEVMIVHNQYKDQSYNPMSIQIHPDYIWQVVEAHRLIFCYNRVMFFEHNIILITYYIKNIKHYSRLLIKFSEL